MRMALERTLHVLRSYQVTVPILMGVVLVMICAASVSSAISNSNSVRRSNRQQSALNTQLLALMARLNLTPESLAAAGLTSTQARAVAVNLSEAVGQVGAELEQLDIDEASTAVELHGAARATALGSRPADLTPIRTRLDSVRQRRETILETARSAAGLSPEQIALVALIQSNRRHDLPIEYLCVSRTEQEWVSLSARLAAAASNAQLRTTKPVELTVSPSDPVDDFTSMIRERLSAKGDIERAIMDVARR